MAQQQWREQYENVLDKFGSVPDIAHSMEFIVEGEPLDSDLKPEDFSLVQIGDEFWLTTLNYDKFWKLAGENIGSSTLALGTRTCSQTRFLSFA